jgi:hypothetical protein
MGDQASAPRPGTKLQVIGAGLPRTGTASFTEALRILLDGPVYHGGTQMTLGPESDTLGWIKVLSLLPASAHSEQTRQSMLGLIRERMDGYAACTDAPCCGTFPQLLELYPDAKVICTTRDPASWERSMNAVASVSTMWFLRILMLPLPTMRYFVDYINALRRQYLYLYGEQEPLRQDVYHQHISWLKKLVPEDGLFFVDVKDGWRPLCEALGKEVPDQPFPNLNDAEAIDNFAAKMVMKGLQRWGVIIGAAATLGGTAWWLLKGNELLTG